MLASQRALLDRILDYAGLFPPARLSLDEALRDYARYQHEPESWLLARFVCPASRLEEVTPYVDTLFNPGVPLRISALGRGGENGRIFLANLRLDLDAVRRFHEHHGAEAAVECFETRLPDDSAGIDGHKSVDDVLTGAAEAFAIAQLGPLPCFYELPLIGDCQQTVNAVAGVLATLNGGGAAGGLPEEDTLKVVVPEGHARHFTRGPAGIKLRCGGLDPAAVPSAAQVAAAIEECVAAGVPLKFTAGLHHLTRRLDPGLGTYVHGFLNVFAGGILAYALGLDHDDLVAVIEEEDARQFQFSDDVFGWNEAEATVSEIEYARQHRIISFGSCSFDEPRDELRELGLI